MKITLAAIGKQKASPERDLCEKYTRMLPWQVQIHEWESKKQLDSQLRKQAEAEWLLATTASAAIRIALDERGKTLSSEAWAQQIERWQQQGCSHLGLCIGGQDGLDTRVREQSQLVFAFGPLTWPHMLVRAMLMEQLYRAHTILTGHPYHRA